MRTGNSLWITTSFLFVITFQCYTLFSAFVHVVCHTYSCQTGKLLLMLFIDNISLPFKHKSVDDVMINYIRHVVDRSTLICS